jgi:hypothetical protein
MNIRTIHHQMENSHAAVKHQKRKSGGDYTPL